MSLKILSWNLENFFLIPSTLPHIQRKPSEKVKKIKEVFLELSPDIAFLTEVGGKDSLDEFNNKSLKDEYRVSLLKGNSPRGIEIGYLIKKKWLQRNDLIFDHISHSKKPIEFLYPHEKVQNQKAMLKGKSPALKSHCLSRDLAELRVYRKKDTLKLKPILVILGVHLKSKLDKDGIDWQGKRRRQAESKYLAKIYNKLYEKWNSSVPIFITGDFNGEFHQQQKDPEFNAINEIEDLRDFTEQLSIPREECFSFIGIDKHKRNVQMQLDYFLLSKKFYHLLEKKHCGFFRYKNEKGAPLPIPQNPGAKYGLPSDHYPLVVQFNKDILDKVKSPS